MSMERDPIEQLRRAVRRPIPTAEERDVALDRLRHAIATDLERREHRSRRSLRGMLAAAAVAVAMMMIAGPMLLRSPAQAALTEFAVAARQATPLEVPRGSFIHSKSQRRDLVVRPGEDFGLSRDFVAYLLPTSRQVWRDPAEAFIRINTAIGRPEFFDSDVEVAYYAAGLDQADQVGENVIEELTEVTDPVIETVWPVDPDRLLESMTSFVIARRSSTADAGQLIDLAADILRETNPSPDLRSAVLHVISQQPVDLEERTARTVTVSYGGTDRRIDLTLSSKGHLLSERVTLLEADPELGLPRGTVISHADHAESRIVADLP